MLAFPAQLIAKRAKTDFGRQTVTISTRIAQSFKLRWKEERNIAIAIFLSGDFPVGLSKLSWFGKFR